MDALPDAKQQHQSTEGNTLKHFSSLQKTEIQAYALWYILICNA